MSQNLSQIWKEANANMFCSGHSIPTPQRIIPNDWYIYQNEFSKVLRSVQIVCPYKNIYQNA